MKKAKKSGTDTIFICDPVAGEPQNPTGRLNAALEALHRHGIKVEVVLIHPKTEAEKVARKAIRKGYQTIIGMGGDGTIEAIMRAIVGTDTRLGILHAGTENNVSRTLGIPTDFDDACEVIAQGECQKIDVGRIKMKKRKNPFYFLEFVAVGLLAAVFPEGKGLNRHQPGAIVRLLKTGLKYTAPTITLTIDGQPIERVNSLTVTVSNTPAFGQRYLVAPDAAVNDGQLDINLYPHISKAGLLAYFTAVMDDRQTRAWHIERFQGSRISIKCQPKQPVIADGIVLGKGKIKIKVFKEALRVLAPSIHRPPDPDFEKYQTPSEFRDRKQVDQEAYPSNIRQY